MSLHDEPSTDNAWATMQTWRQDGLILVFGLNVPLIALLGEALLPSGTAASQPFSISVLGVGGALFSVLIFLRDGQNLITPLGVFQLANAIFVSASPLLMSIAGFEPNPYLALTLTAIHTANVAICAVIRYHAVRETPPIVGSAPARRTTVAHNSGRGLFSGLTFFAIASLLLARGVIVGDLPARIAHAAIVLITVGVVLRPRSTTRRWVAMAVPAALIAVYYTYFFTGFGRLLVATLVLAVVVITNMVGARRWHKLAIITGIGPALIVSGLIGVDRSPITAGQGSVSQVVLKAQGLDSVFSPADTFAALVDLDRNGSPGSFPRLHGRSFRDALVTWVPRSWWPEKPVGFGSRLTQVLAPRLIGTGHSMAALSWGEWFANFGWFGLLLSCFVTPPLLISLGKWQRRLVDGAPWTSKTQTDVAAYAVAIAGIADYVWVGSFTYFARCGVVLVVLLVARVVMLVMPSRLHGTAVEAEHSRRAVPWRVHR